MQQPVWQLLSERLTLLTRLYSSVANTSTLLFLHGEAKYCNATRGSLLKLPSGQPQRLEPGWKVNWLRQGNSTFVLILILLTKGCELLKPLAKEHTFVQLMEGLHRGQMGSVTRSVPVYF
jgi:hypothetical protein